MCENIIYQFVDAFKNHDFEMIYSLVADDHIIGKISASV